MASRFAFNNSSTDEDLPRPQDFARLSGEQKLTGFGDRREARHWLYDAPSDDTGQKRWFDLDLVDDLRS